MSTNVLISNGTGSTTWTTSYSYSDSDVIAFSTNGIDTHGACIKGVHYGLLNLLNKLNLGKATNATAYVIPATGIYSINNDGKAFLRSCSAGDIIPVYTSCHIHRL